MGEIVIWRNRKMLKFPRARRRRKQWLWTYESIFEWFKKYRPRVKKNRGRYFFRKMIENITYQEQPQ